MALNTFIFVGIISITVYIIILQSFSPLEQLLETTDLSGIFVLGFIIPGFICLFAFMGSLYGMSNEILSSREFYTPLKSSFMYFRKYWWHYFLIALYFFYIIYFSDSLCNTLNSDVLFNF